MDSNIVILLNEHFNQKYYITLTMLQRAYSSSEI